MVIIRLYEEYILGHNYGYKKYIACMLIQYLISASMEQFVEEFNVRNEQDIEQFGNLFYGRAVASVDELIMKVNMMKHIEYSWIAF